MIINSQVPTQIDLVKLLKSVVFQRLSVTTSLLQAAYNTLSDLKVKIIFSTFSFNYEWVKNAMLTWLTVTIWERNKSPFYWTGSYSNSSLAMSYSHMGKPHTTIGAITFHFWVRHGIRWVHNAMVAKQILSLYIIKSNLESCIVFLITFNLFLVTSNPFKTPWVLYG